MESVEFQRDNSSENKCNNEKTYISGDGQYVIFIY